MLYLFEISISVNVVATKYEFHKTNLKIQHPKFKIYPRFSLTRIGRKSGLKWTPNHSQTLKRSFFPLNESAYYLFNPQLKTDKMQMMVWVKFMFEAGLNPNQAH